MVNNHPSLSLVLYHGSRYKFDGTPKEIIVKNGKDIGKGFYLTTSKENAIVYSEGKFLYSYFVERIEDLKIVNKEVSPTGRNTVYCIDFKHSKIKFLGRSEING